MVQASGKRQPWAPAALVDGGHTVLCRLAPQGSQRTSPMLRAPVLAPLVAARPEFTESMSATVKLKVAAMSESASPACRHASGSPGSTTSLRAAGQNLVLPLQCPCIHGPCSSTQWTHHHSVVATCRLAGQGVRAGVVPWRQTEALANVDSRVGLERRVGLRQQQQCQKRRPWWRWHRWRRQQQAAEQRGQAAATAGGVDRQRRAIGCNSWRQWQQWQFRELPALRCCRLQAGQSSSNGARTASRPSSRTSCINKQQGISCLRNARGVCVNHTHMGTSALGTG